MSGWRLAEIEIMGVVSAALPPLHLGAREEGLGMCCEDPWDATVVS